MTHPRHVLRSIALATLLVLGVAAPACNRSRPSELSQEGHITVFAAASLREVFSAIGEDFKRAHPGIELTFQFAGTQELRTQLEHGASVDVFASADQHHMDELVAASRAAAPVVFARNEPVIVVATEAASTIRGIADLPSAAHIVVGTPEVPIGRYTQQILDRASLTLGPDFRQRVESRVSSHELNVRQVLAKVILGEAQAGIVYRTDAQAAEGRVSVVTIPSEINVIADYPIAVVTGAPHPKLARAWVDSVLSSGGQHALRSAGFLAPSGDRTLP